MTQIDTRLAWLDHVADTEGWLSLEEAKLLHSLASGVRDGCIVEVGAFRGRSTIALSAGAGEGVPVFSIDPHEEMWVDGRLAYSGPRDREAFFEAMIRSGAWKNVNLLNTRSETIAPGWDTPVALLWIDGDHSEEGVRRDWDAWQSHLIPGSIVAFDDAHDPNIGPFHLIADLIASGDAEHLKNVGKVRSVTYNAPRQA